jgi:hypothetical protein
MKLEHPKKYLIMETKTENKEKVFDAIKVMREIRDTISLEIMDMTYEEEREYLDKLLANAEDK